MYNSILRFYSSYLKSFTYEDTSAAYGNLLVWQLYTQCLGVRGAYDILQPFNTGCLFKLVKHPIGFTDTFARGSKLYKCSANNFSNCYKIIYIGTHTAVIPEYKVL